MGEAAALAVERATSIHCAAPQSGGALALGQGEFYVYHRSGT
jgi:hypothetical protein